MVQRSGRFLKRKLETISKVSRWYFELLELVSRLMNPSPHHHLHLLHSLRDLFRNPKLKPLYNLFRNPELRTVWQASPHHHHLHLLHYLSGTFSETQNSNLWNLFRNPEQTVWWPLWNFGSKQLLTEKKSTLGLCRNNCGFWPFLKLCSKWRLSLPSAYWRCGSRCGQPWASSARTAGHRWLAMSSSRSWRKGKMV